MIWLAAWVLLSIGIAPSLKRFSIRRRSDIDAFARKHWGFDQPPPLPPFHLYLAGAAVMFAGPIVLVARLVVWMAGGG